MASPKTNCMISFLFILSVQHLIPLNVTSYTPIHHFAINCGSNKSQTSLDNRNWITDTHSKLVSIIQPQNHPSVAATAPHLPPSVPYSTTRLSRSEFSYSFLVTEGPKFIRLHFYPASYPGFHRFDSLFSVKTNHYTLLNHFNASHHADNHNNPHGTFWKEYCIYVESGHRLNITFTPSSTTHPQVYAFINGIEVLSVPNILYHTLINGTGNTAALETAYRINVGGNKLSGEQDWEDDVCYLVTPRSTTSVAVAGSGSGITTLEHGVPEQVYLSARTFGIRSNKTKENSKNDVAWEFKVDSNFTYMIRLHFCEFREHAERVGDRVFQIFITDTLVESHADVIKWRGANNHKKHVPVYKDYVVPVLNKEKTSNSSEKLHLSVKLQPHPYKSKNHDVILNGIEIFKLSNNNNLGGSSNPSQPPTSPKVPPKTSKKNMKIPILASVAAASVFVLLTIVFLIFRCVKKGAAKDGNPEPSSTRCHHFSIAQIRAATNNFHDGLIIGKGGFGNVYKGHIDTCQKPVAIKRLKPGSDQGAHEFQTEIKMLSQFRHPHLVSLIGYCNDDGEMILVYDFMARGTLRDHLYGSDHNTQPLSWDQRLNICLAAARGLQFLHAGVNKQSVIHRDVKSTNILLDEDWVAKVSDFGLSKVGPNASHVTTDVKGSFGYLDPEYYMSLWLTQKSDVYSFGVVLLEILCGRAPIKCKVAKHEEFLVTWVKRCFNDGNVDQTLDPVLRGTIRPKCLKKFVEIALSCLNDHGKQRPLMRDVVKGLEYASSLQQCGRDIVQGKGKNAQVSLSLAKIERLQEFDGRVDETSSSKATTTCSEEEQALVHGMFSQLGNPTAR